MIYLVTNQVEMFNSKLFKIISVEEGVELLKPCPELGLDTETEGLDCYTKGLLLLQIGTDKFQVVFDISSFGGVIPVVLREYLNTTESTFILQNAKFDLKFLFHQKVLIRKVFDTMLAEIIITNGLQYDGMDLETIVEKYCGEHLDKTVRGEIITTGLSDRVIVYGARDVEFLPMVKRKQLAAITELKLTRAVELDNAFVVVLAYIEYCGIKLDFEKWHARTVKSMQEVLELKTQLEEQLWKDGKFKYFSGMTDLWSGKQDCTINWSSPKQVIALFKDYGINVILKDKGVDKETVDAKVLEPQKDKFAILPPYLKYKEKQTEISTFGDSWKAKINPVTGRIHTTFKQLMDTGRLSCGNKREGTPNLQNIPADPEARACFVPEKGNVLVDADYSGQESIILANLSKEENLINFYKKGLSDMHSYVAFLMYEGIRPCAVEDVSPETLDYIKKAHKDKRQIAKAAGFAIAYGGNGSTIAKNCNISKSDGEFVYKSYFEAFPAMRDYFDLVFRKASHFAYIQFNNVTQRKYFFNIHENNYFYFRDEVEDPYFWATAENPKQKHAAYNKAKSDVARMAQNYPIQGTAADVTKYAGILFLKEILKRGWWLKVKIVNVVHDEYLVECPIDMVEEVKIVLTGCMSEAGKPFCKTLPLKADAIHGDHWVH